MDEMVEVVRTQWNGGMVEHHGEFYDFDPVEMRPAPPAPVPIYVGGHPRSLCAEPPPSATAGSACTTGRGEPNSTAGPWNGPVRTPAPRTVRSRSSLVTPTAENR